MSAGVAAVAALTALYLARGTSPAEPGGVHDKEPAAPLSASAPPEIAPGIGTVLAANATPPKLAGAHPHESEATRAFEQDGWTMVDETPPDPRVVAFDPSLLGRGERELAAQLASAAAGERDVHNISVIARRAGDASTRVAAVEALGRIESSASQRALLELLTQLERDDPARRHIAPLLHPAGADDPFAVELARLIDDERLHPVEREQIAFTVALIEQRDGRAVPLDGRVTAEAKAKLDKMTALAKGARR